MSETRTPIGKFIHSSWGNLNVRCGKYRHLQTLSKCKKYSNIKILFSREEYKQWCLERESQILSLDRPSLDRINKELNYSLENIQVIELSENIRKEKTVFTETHGRCSSCKENLPIEDFVKDARRLNGRASLCKRCDSIRCSFKKRKASK